MTRSPRAFLMEGDPSPLGVKLAHVFTALWQRGYRVFDVHESPDGRLEVLMDKDIPPELGAELTLPTGIVCYDDHDEDDIPRGIGFLCEATRHCVNGPVSRKGS